MDLKEFSNELSDELMKDAEPGRHVQHSVAKDANGMFVNISLGVYNKFSVLNVSFKLHNFNLPFSDFELYQRKTGISLFFGHKAATLNLKGNANNMSDHYCSQVTTVQSLLDFNDATIGWKDQSLTYFAEIKNKDFEFIPRIIYTLIKFAENCREVDME